MSHKSGMKHHFCQYLMAIAIAFSLQSKAIAQTKPQLPSAVDFSFKNKLSDPWENATLTHNLNALTDINLLKFSPDGKLLAGTGGSNITLWQVTDGQIQSILPGHKTSSGMEIAPIAIAFSPDSRFLATATWSQGLLTPDSSLIVRNVTTGAEVLKLGDAGCRQVVFAPDGATIYGACGLGVTAWSFPEGKKLFDVDPEFAVEAIALSPDGKIMATVDANVSGGQLGEASNQIQLWQLDREPKLVSTLDGHDNDIARLEFTNNGRIISSSYDGKINVWNWQTATIDRRTNNLYSKEGLFSLNSSNTIIAGNFHNSAMTSLSTGLPLRNQHLIPRLKSTQAIAFNPQTEMFAWTGQSDAAHPAAVQLWQTDASTSTVDNQANNQYLSLPIYKYWSSRQPVTNSGKTNTGKPSLIGQDPQAIALAGLGLKTAGSATELKLNQNGNQANVTITQNNLADDSVARIRYLVEFAPYGDRNNQEWHVVKAGQQFKCQQNRGHQDWSADLCK